MPKKKYLVTLSDDERQELEPLLHSGTHATRKVTRARMRLKAIEGWEPWGNVRALAHSRSWTRRPQPASSPQPVARLPQPASAGPCTCWLTVWSRSAWPSRMHRRASAAREKKRTQAVAEEARGHPGGERRVCRC